MSVASHVQELRKKHQNLSEAVERAQRAPGVDDLALTEMKREKLRLKEEIARHVGQRLAAYEYPRRVHFIDDMPMTTTGKIIRADLRQRAERLAEEERQPVG